MFTIAIKEWRLGLIYNPVNNIRKPSVKDSERDRILTPEEEERLLKTADDYSNPMFGWIVRIALNTGMRLSEITSLNCSNLNLENRTVVIYQTKNGETRTVPLNKEATRVFKLALANPIRPKDCELMFFGNPGKDKIRRPYVFNKTWGEVLQIAKIKNLTFHDLRHCAVTNLIKLDLTDQEVASISGHKSMQMLKRYTHLRAENLVDKLG
ncbi:Shufflon-specific DNA recombinase [hydrothermal vent metagenome]|uniref:Shufflon-specific DNA recombinase n=1 Tax=hydrothermal vent metagenome TaxID=652676 RepID=A0A3B0Y7R2_9ZZZZ